MSSVTKELYRLSQKVFELETQNFLTKITELEKQNQEHLKTIEKLNQENDKLHEKIIELEKQKDMSIDCEIQILTDMLQRKKDILEKHPMPTKALRRSDIDYEEKNYNQNIHIIYVPLIQLLEKFINYYTKISKRLNPPK